MAACRRIGVPAAVTTNARQVAAAEALILPGVGAFAKGMESLRRHDLIEPIRDAAAAGTPILLRHHGEVMHGRTSSVCRAPR